MVCDEAPQPSSALLPGNFTKYSFPEGTPLCYSRKYSSLGCFQFRNDPACHWNRRQCSAWRSWAPTTCCRCSCEWEWSRRSRGVRSPGITWASYYTSWCSRESWASRISSRGLYSACGNLVLSLERNEFPPYFGVLPPFWRSVFTWVYL